MVEIFECWEFGPTYNYTVNLNDSVWSVNFRGKKYVIDLKDFDEIKQILNGETIRGYLGLGGGSCSIIKKSDCLMMNLKKFNEYNIIKTILE